MASDDFCCNLRHSNTKEKVTKTVPHVKALQKCSASIPTKSYGFNSAHNPEVYSEHSRKVTLAQQDHKRQLLSRHSHHIFEGRSPFRALSELITLLQESLTEKRTRSLVSRKEHLQDQKKHRSFLLVPISRVHSRTGT